MSKSNRKPKYTGVNKRAKVKYPALERSLNLKSRRYYIEPDYIDGVVDVNSGERVIRALTESEKAWLDKFYKETIITSFEKDDTNFYNDVEDKRQLYRENNRRNVCLFNDRQKTGQLQSLDVDQYETYLQEKLEGVDLDQIMWPEGDGILSLYDDLRNAQDIADKYDKTPQADANFWRASYFKNDWERGEITKEELVFTFKLMPLKVQKGVAEYLSALGKYVDHPCKKLLKKYSKSKYKVLLKKDAKKFEYIWPHEASSSSSNK